jgi:hypothetical protein
VVVVVEEEARGAEDGAGGRVEVGSDADDSCVGVGIFFLRLRQGLSSASTSLRRHFARAHARAGGADIDADAGS